VLLNPGGRSPSQVRRTHLEAAEFAAIATAHQDDLRYKCTRHRYKKLAIQSSKSSRLGSSTRWLSKSPLTNFQNCGPSSRTTDMECNDKCRQNANLTANTRAAQHPEISRIPVAVSTQPWPSACKISHARFVRLAGRVAPEYDVVSATRPRNEAASLRRSPVLTAMRQIYQPVAGQQARSMCRSAWQAIDTQRRRGADIRSSYRETGRAQTALDLKRSLHCGSARASILAKVEPCCAALVPLRSRPYHDDRGCPGGTALASADCQCRIERLLVRWLLAKSFCSARQGFRAWWSRSECTATQLFFV
jgi:hypothetical protein